jgi:hypothetical protein
MTAGPAPEIEMAGEKAAAFAGSEPWRWARKIKRPPIRRERRTGGLTT